MTARDRISRALGYLAAEPPARYPHPDPSCSPNNPETEPNNPELTPEETRARIEELETARMGLAQAIRLTREYVGADVLPAVKGWDWYDALRRWAPDTLPDDAPPVPGADPGPTAEQPARTTPKNPPKESP